MKSVLFLPALLVAFSLKAQVYEGVSTHFEALGTPYGGCGVPLGLLDTEHFVALNVFSTPNIDAHQDYTRPIAPENAHLIGEFDNGMNCGRWVKVTIMENCVGGINDGALNQEFCRGPNGQWVHDKYSGAVLYMIVTDACGDNNGWCRNSAFHLDLFTESLNKFEIDGQPVGDMYPLHFNNRKIAWEYVKAPNYQGDIDIYFLQDAQYYWPAIMVNKLENGISAVEQKINGQWQPAIRNSDMGQAFILSGSGQFTIRVKDSDGNYINFAREYTFSMPVSCGAKCLLPATKTDYTAYTPPVTQNIGLTKGWNLVSVNVFADDNTVQSVFEGLPVSHAYSDNGFWASDIPDYLFSLNNLEHGKAYMLYAQADTVLSITGTPMRTGIPELARGWNMIGAPSFAPVPIVETALWQQQGIIIKDMFTCGDHSTPAFRDLVLHPGKGYYVFIP
jgi:hypothetical protein